MHCNVAMYCHVAIYTVYESVEMLEELLVAECYICQESCVEKSPCECQASVHSACLEKFCSISHNNSCTICKTLVSPPIELERESEEVQLVERESVEAVHFSFYTRLFLGFLFYFVMGVLGQTMLQMYNGEQVHFVSAFWSVSFVTSSLVTTVGITIVGFCLCVFHRLLHRLVDNLYI